MSLPGVRTALNIERGMELLSAAVDGGERDDDVSLR